MSRLQKYLPIVFSQTQMVSIFKFKSLTMEFILVEGYRNVSFQYIFLKLYIQSSKHSFLFSLLLYFSFYLQIHNFKIITHTFWQLCSESNKAAITKYIMERKVYNQKQKEASPAFYSTNT